MELSRALEQHIAVFGESGSGKTVLLSSFYGGAQEPQFLQTSLFNVIADDVGQGSRLHRNYLGMKNSGTTPEPNRFSATSYSFSVRLKEGGKSKAAKSGPFDALRLVWHDYPGEWFEANVSGSEEAQRRVDTFRSLLGADVALVLVDGQRLLDNAGEEERYLRSLLANVRNGLLAIKDELLQDGRPLVEFPRIWIMALSKSDLLPQLNVFDFRDILIERAADDIHELRRMLAGLVEESDALSVGEDFVLLSSAKFDAGRIEVTRRVGLDLILPLAAMLPFERHVRWADQLQFRGKVAENLLRGVEIVAGVLTGNRIPGKWGAALRILGPILLGAAKLTAERLAEINKEAVARRDYMRAVLAQFGLDLDKGEEDRVLLRSRR